MCVILLVFVFTSNLATPKLLLNSWHCSEEILLMESPVSFWSKLELFVL